ncbi:MAG TPA: DNA repair protein RadA, partial [Gammaproteobacteria bacterium]|nr:DNA repair protein RadA [Gammaproteobacteria bacterium]
MAAKARTLFICNECGATQAKWAGQCPDCGAWNTLEETVQHRAVSSAEAPRGQYAGDSGVRRLSEVPQDEE